MRIYLCCGVARSRFGFCHEPAIKDARVYITQHLIGYIHLMSVGNKTLFRFDYFAVPHSVPYRFISRTVAW
jgi:hypothetical protein